MRIEFTAGTIRMLRGAPLSVLMVLALAHQPVTVEYLEGATGYTYKSISSALRFLTEMQYVCRTGRYAWQLAQAVQLPLMAEPEEELDENRVGKIPTPEEDSEDCRQDDENRVGKIPTPEVVDGENEPENGNRVGKIPTPDALKLSKLRVNPDSDVNLLTLRAEENFRTMRELGFWGEKAAVVAKMAHVNPRMIRYWAAHSESLDLALYRIRNNWRVPRDWIEPEPGAEACPVCGMVGEHAPQCARRYISGEFQEFVER